MGKLIAAAAALSFLAGVASGHDDAGPGMGWWPMMGGMWCPLVWLVVAVVVVVLIVLGVKYFMPKGPAGKAGKSSLEILKERYAKGEITKAEFEEMKRDLAE